jgi:hypothetical protein
VKQALHHLAVLLAALAFAAAPLYAADDERTDKVDAPGGKIKGPMKPLESKTPGPAPGAAAADDARSSPGTPDVTDGTPMVPPLETSKRLVTETLLSFNRSLRSKSFTSFHIESLSKQFQAEFPADRLLATFQPFIASDANLGGVESVEPVFDPPPFVDDNVLKLKGSYSTRPMRVKFDLDFALEKRAWKLNAMTVSLKSTPPPMGGGGAPGGNDSAGGDTGAAVSVPSEPELARMVNDTLTEFNACVKKGDFTPLMAKASTPMRMQMKPARLKEAFASFIENGTDIGAIAGAQPEFDGAPSVQGKVLSVAGRYRVLPLFVVFNIDYYRENGRWNLSGISVNTISPAEFKRDLAAGSGTSAAKESSDGQVDPDPPAMRKALPMKDSEDGRVDPNPEPAMKKAQMKPDAGGRIEPKPGEMMDKK